MTKASRFAILKIDNDEDERIAQSLRDKQKALAEKQSGKNGNANKAQNIAEKNAVKKGKIAQEKAELKALAFGGSKPKKSASAKKKNTASAVNSLPAEWKNRDEELVEADYERQLAEALLASKMELQKEKTLVTSQDKMVNGEAEVSKEKKQGKKKGTTTMSLDQFNLPPQVKEMKKAPMTNGKSAVVDDSHFFDDVSEEAKKLAKKEKNRTQAANKKQAKIPELPESPRVAHIQEELRLRTEEVETLRLENEKLREDLLNAKTRSKRLCNILAQGEMKEKAELIVEMEKMTKVKDELTVEIDRLSSQLQQERSKVTALTDSKKALGPKK